MKTKTVPPLFLSMLILLTTSYANPTTPSSATPSLPNNTEPSTNTPQSPNTTKATMKTETMSNSTSTMSPSPLPSSTVTTHRPQTRPLTTRQTTTGQITTASPAESHKPWLVAILLVIVALMVFVGCVYCWRERRSAGEGSTPRILLDMRERLRTGIGNLEDRLGIQLWPDNKSVGEEDEEDEEEEDVEDVEEGGNDKGQASHDGVQLTNVNEKQEPKEEDSETSSEDDSGTEDAVKLQREEERSLSQSKQNISGGQSSTESESSRDSEGGPEEADHLSSSKKSQENTDLFDVTAL